MYKVNEIFYSLQGEGRWSGRPAVFVRMSGCNLKCPFCDTDFKGYKEMSAEDILAACLEKGGDCRFIVLTGGEPTLQVDAELIHLLHQQGYYLSMETDGTHEVSNYGLETTYQYLQPCDVGNDARNRFILSGCIDYVKRHPEWQLSLQMHKIVGIR